MTSGIIVSSEVDSTLFELLTKGREVSQQLGIQLCALSLRDPDGKNAQECFQYGAQEVVAVPSIGPSGLDPEVYARVLFQVMKEGGPDILLLGSTKLGKETAGRIAQLLQAGCASDAIGISVRDSELLIERYSLGGNTISSEVITTKKKIISVMPRTFEAQPAPTTGTVTTLDFKPPPQRVMVVERREKAGEKVSIESAENLVCVGQGLGKKEDLKLINDLCAALKAELGCTRALSSDFHWLSEDRMVGISGKKCKPKLHVSIGVSGQIQHTVGVMSAKLIVAINKDKEAPIFKIADYGIVGDLYQVVPKLTQRLKISAS